MVQEDMCKHRTIQEGTGRQAAPLKDDVAQLLSVSTATSTAVYRWQQGVQGGNREGSSGGEHMRGRGDGGGVDGARGWKGGINKYRCRVVG